MNKTIYYLTTLLFFAVSSATAQKIISANGGTATAPGTEVSWTIGEPITATVSDGTTTLTQGFHQTKLTVTAVNEIQVPDVKIKVYPNPTSDFVMMHLNKTVEKTTYLLFDITGKLIQQKNMESTDTKIDLNGVANGSYILKLKGGQRPLQTFKIIKR